MAPDKEHLNALCDAICQSKFSLTSTRNKCSVHCTSWYNLMYSRVMKILNFQEVVMNLKSLS